MTNEEKYVAEKFRGYKREMRVKMAKALVDAGYTCNEIAVAFNLQESTVRSCANSDDENGQNVTE